MGLEHTNVEWVPIALTRAPRSSVLSPSSASSDRSSASSATSALNPLAVGMVSLGCPKNLVDGEVMLGHLARRGHRLVGDAREANVIVVNTCAFIDRAKQESIDATLGTGQVDEVLRAVEGEATVTDAAVRRPEWIYDHTSPRVLTTPPHLAYVKISEGCDYTCSFCIIPTLRGLHRSRPADDVVAEAQALAARGVKEIILVAQDSTRYGRDLGLRDGLAVLLRRLGGVDGVRWIRVMYAYPATVTDAVLDAIASEDKVVKYVDMPLQHASEPVLKRMKRPTGRGNLLGMVERVRARVPGVAFRTSFIVGFPGETEADFQELLAFTEAAEFDNVGVFTFSDEEGTASFDLPDRVAPPVKEARRRRLLALQKGISARRHRRLVGQRVEVLVEGTHPDSDLLLRGRTAAQAPEIDGAVIINDGTADPGSFVTCEVTEAHPYDLVARIVAP